MIIHFNYIERYSRYWKMLHICIHRTKECETPIITHERPVCWVECEAVIWFDNGQWGGHIVAYSTVCSWGECPLHKSGVWAQWSEERRGCAGTGRQEEAVWWWSIREVQLAINLGFSFSPRPRIIYWIDQHSCSLSNIICKLITIVCYVHYTSYDAHFSQSALAN